MRAVLCGCGKRLEADEDGSLCDSGDGHVAPNRWSMRWSTRTEPLRTRSLDSNLTELARGR